MCIRDSYYGDDDHGDEGGCCIPNEDAMERGWYDDELFSECPEHKTYKSCEPERGPTRACEWVEDCGDDDWGWHDDDDDDAYSYSYTPDDDLDDTWRPDDDWSYEWDDDWWKWDDDGHEWDDDWWKWDDDHGDEGGCCVPDEYSMEQGWYDDELFSKCPEHKTKKSCEPELAYCDWVENCADDDHDDEWGWHDDDDAWSYSYYLSLIHI